jgi:hypothetical protein
VRKNLLFLWAAAADLAIDGVLGTVWFVLVVTLLATGIGTIPAFGLGSVVIDSSAGDTRLSFVSLPTSIQAKGSAGDIEVRLPDGDYDVRASTSFGDVDQRLRSTPGADRRYTFETSAGNIALRNE